jgi:hypothetical protein
MIAAFMLYGIAIAALIALAALVAERALGALGLARRGLWAAAIAASLLVPPALMLGRDGAAGSSAESSSLPAPAVGTAAEPESIEPTALRPELPAVTKVATRLSPPKWNTVLGAAWLAVSVTLACLYLIAWLHARRQLRSWHSQSIAGHTVALSEDVGPAVFGVASPTIIVPRWFAEASPPLQSLVLEHERQHIAARDQWLLAFAALAVIVAPWNLPLWWQLRRLRFAVEVDCDARVLGSGIDPLVYGEALLHVGRRYLRAPAGAVALIEPPSDLERRIRIMTTDRGRHVAVVALACAAACASLVAVAARIEPPSVDAELKLLPPRASLPAQVAAVVRETYPELFAPDRAQPALVKLLLNSDFSIDWSEASLLPAGTTQQEAETIAQPKETVLSKLDPDEPRILSTLVLPAGVESPPVFVVSAVHAYPASRSPAAVESALKKRYPELYDDAADADVLLIALMNEDGSVDRAVQRPRLPGESLVGEADQRRAFEALQPGAIDVGVMAIIGKRSATPFRPTVLYAFRNSGDPALDGSITLPENPAKRIATQRALVERHFPEIADGSTNPHHLLWVLLDPSGDVVAAGRTPTSPDPLMVDLERQYPGAATARRTTTQLAALFGREMRDVEGQPLLVTFAWLDDESRMRAREPSSATGIAVETTVYRNGQFVSTTPMMLAVGKPQIHTSDLLRLDVTAIDASKELVDLGFVLRVPVADAGIEFAERWEIVSQPMIRTRLGEAAVIEQGVKYPGKTGDVLWRIEIKPRSTN